MSDLIDRQAAIEYFLRNVGWTDEDGHMIDDWDDLKKIWTDLFNGVPSAQQWIPVSNRLPKPNELDGNVTRFYLVQNGYGDMMVASFNKSSVSECTWWEQIYQYGEELSDIVAWMPLPESWKGETYG